MDDQLHPIRLRAMAAVMRHDLEYFVRQVMRWYSKTFFTPLAQVEEIPLEDVFEAFYEERYEGMDEDTLARERQLLLTTQREHHEQMMREDEEEVEMFELSKSLAEEERAKAAKPKKKLPGQIADLEPQNTGRISRTKPAESDLPNVLPKVLPPDIKMTFVSDAEFEREIEGFGTMTPPPPK